MSTYILTTPYSTYMVTRVLTNWFWWAMWVPNPDTPASLSALFPPHVILIKRKTDMHLSSRLLSAACAQKRSAPNSFCGSGWDQMLQQPVYVKSSFLIKCKDTLVDDAVIKNMIYGGFIGILQGSFCPWAHPMRGCVILLYVLSLAEPIPRMIPALEN